MSWVSHNKLIFVFLMMFLLVGTVSALEFDNIKSYDKETKEITIKNAFGIPFIGNDLAIYKLTYNTDQCLINCRAEGTATLYTNNHLFTDLRFRDIEDEWTESISRKIYIEVDNPQNIYDYTTEEICGKVHLNGSKNCREEIIQGEIIDTKSKMEWIEYDGSVLDEGNYKWRIEGKKSPSESVDWIVSAFGIDMEDWEWWNTDWFLRKQFNVTGGSVLLENIPILINITKETDMQDDFEDIRFINGTCIGVQDTELEFDKTNFTTNNAFFWVNMTLAPVTGNNMFCMYFFNNDATEASDPLATYGFNNVWHFDATNSTGSLIDATNNNNCTTSAVPTFVNGEMGRAVDFAGTITSTCGANNLNVGKNLTVLVLAQTDTIAPTKNTLYNSGAGGNSFRWTYGNSVINTLELAIDGGEFQADQGLWIQNIFQQWSLTHNVTTAITYLNGTQNDTKAFTQTLGNLVSFNISNDGSGVAFDGEVDELWIDNKTRSEAWLQRWYNNTQFDLITFSSPIDIQKLTIDVTLQNPANDTNTTRDNFNFNATFTSTVAGNLTNATLFLWDQLDDSLFTTNFSISGGIANSSNFSVSGLLSNTTYLWNYFVCGINQSSTVCNMATNNFTFNVISLLFGNEFFNTPVEEGITEIIQMNLTLHSDRSISLARLVYNNTNFIPIITNPSDNFFSLSASITTPDVTTSTNVPFFWNITLDNTENFTSTSQDQVVNPVNIDDCSSFTNVIMNLTVVDEELQNTLNDSTIEVALNITDDSGQNSISTFSTNTTVNPFAICLETQINNGTRLSLGAIIQYSTPSHAIEHYNIVNFSLTNLTMARNITLFDLNISDSTEFQLTFTGSDFVAVENALVFVDRQYIAENTFKTVELPKTDSNGQTVLHLVRNDIIYNIRVSKGGVVLGNFENLVAFCEDFTIGDCKIILDAGASTEALFNYDEELGITFTVPSFNNNTRLITFDFLTNDGSSKTVLMNVTRSDIFGNRTICESTLLSPGGTLSCTVPANIDDADLRVSVFVDGQQAVFKILKLDSTNFGVVGFLVLLIMSMSLILMFSSSKTGVLFAIVLGFAGGVGLGLISSNVIGLGASGLWLIIIGLIGVWKLNKERSQ